MVGEVVAGRYELEELVGTGGMSSVFRAKDTLLERNVALKILHEHYTSDEDYVERFRREARSVAQLAHPNIVTVIDRGEQDGRQFIVFEYVEGESLKQLVDRTGPLPVEQAVELALQIGRALSFAHQQGLVHRDVKPQNVLLNDDGRAKVTDFGIARSLDVQHGMTQTGTVMGTSDYIAPEQARGERVDEQTDVYSLGVVLYELLTGEVPFPGENFVAVAMRHINEPPPSVRARRPDVPPRLDAAIQRAMAKEPRDRFASMGELVAELEASLDDVAGPDEDTGTIVIPARPPGVARPRARRWPIVVALALLLLAGAAAAAVYLHGRSSSHHHSAPPAVHPVRVVAVTSFDPYGDNKTEHDDVVDLATDGNPNTFWTTEQYDTRDLGKPGVGLVLDAHRSVRLRTVTLVSDTPGYTVVIKSGPSSSGPFAAASARRVVGRTTTFRVRGDAERYYLIWIVDLGGNTAAHVNAVRATGS